MKQARLKGVEIWMQYYKHWFPLVKMEIINNKITKNKVFFFFMTQLLYLIRRWVSLTTINLLDSTNITESLIAVAFTKHG